MRNEYKTDVDKRTESKARTRLKKCGFKLVKSRGDHYGGYAILAYNEAIDAWVEAEGMTPVAYSLDLEDVIRLTHEYLAEAETEQLAAG